MTAHAMEEERRKALETGMDDHISKPIDPDAMFETMRRFYRPAGSARTTEQIAPPRDGEASFPSIEGMDVTAGLRRVAGNRRLYRSLLQRFVDGQESCARDIVKALEQGDVGLAEMRAHTLNGIAGTLGVGAVQTTAAELEKQLREKDSAEKIEETRIRLDAVLRATVDAIRSMLRHVEASRDGDVPGPPLGDPNAALGRLSRLIEENDSEALEVFESMRTTWESIAGREETKTLADLLFAYDFASALPHVKRLQQAMRASRGGGEADGGLE
jgi:two-component system sensor histidine kinase/response regulator